MPNLDTAFGIHAQALVLRSARAEVLAMNLANADTPHYQARDLDFADALAGAEAGLERTSPKHLSGAHAYLRGALLKYRNPEQASLDQNTVDPQVEHSAFLQNAVQYEASVRFLQGRIASLMVAIRGE